MLETADKQSLVYCSSAGVMSWEEVYNWGHQVLKVKAADSLSNV